MRKSRGFTLLELLIATAALTLVVFYAGNHISAFSRFYQRTGRYVQSETDFILLAKQMEGYFARGTAVSFKQQPGIVAQTGYWHSRAWWTCGQGAPCPTHQQLTHCQNDCISSYQQSCGKGCTQTICNGWQASWVCTQYSLPGFDVHQAGAAILNTDLRACSDFDPAQSRTAPNVTQVRLVCCSQAMQLAVQLPESGPTVTVTSACTETPGLGIELWQNGATISRTCYPYVKEFNVGPIGKDEVSGENIRYYSLTSSELLPTTGGGVIEGTRPRFEIYLFPGNSGKGISTKCQDTTINL